MSVWPDPGASAPALVGSEGELVSIRISVEPRLLEKLLENLARLEFPINPEINHNPGGATLVEFPAWGGRLSQIREAVRWCGLAPDAVAVRSMIDRSHTVGAGASRVAS